MLSVTEKKDGKVQVCMLASAVVTLEIHFISKVNPVNGSAEDHRL